MRLTVLVCSLVVSAVGLTTARQLIRSANNLNSIEYPYVRRDESVIDNLHGINVADPYRWLEDANSEETTRFVDDENQISEAFLKSNDKYQKIKEKLTSLWNYPKYFVPERHGEYYFSFKNTGLQNQNVLYKQSSLTDEPTVFFDPNTLSVDDKVALRDTIFSKDGKLMAYSFSESGKDWKTFKVRNVETGHDYPDVIKGIKFRTVSWMNDNKGFFYCRFPYYGNDSDTGALKNQKMFYHRVGDAQEKDVLVVEFPENPSWLIHATVSDCGKYLFVRIAINDRDKMLYFADLEKNGPIIGRITLTPITNRFEAEYKEDEKDVLAAARCVDSNKIVLHYLHDVKSILQVHSLESGQLIRKFPLEIGSIIGFSGSKNSSAIFYQLASFLTPGIIYKYDFSNPDIEPTVFREVELNLHGFDKNNFKVEQVFYPSRDGTKIPMFIVQKNIALNVPKPKACLLHAYGGFNAALLPKFNAPFLFFVHHFDGILAIPNIRGGGEYGTKWHDAGRMLNKQNGYDDFQAAAKYLVEKRYTKHHMIAIRGASNGGLLVGASITQRPDLFGVAVAQVGVMGMLRFHKFTIGRAWFSEYGNPDEKIHFENLYKYSPLHNIRSPNSTQYQYPATLITTADHDDRVPPLHSYKFTAELQHAVQHNPFQVNPIYLKTYKNAGHGEGIPIVKQIEEETDLLAFLLNTLPINSNL